MKTRTRLFALFALGLGLHLQAQPTTVVSDHFTNLSNWVFPGPNVFNSTDGLQIPTTAPAAIWLNQKLTAPCTISFDAVRHLVLCRIERRPPRLDMANWPHLPLAQVRTTRATDYMALLTSAVAAPVIRETAL